MSELNWDTLYIDHTSEYELLVSHEDHLNELIAAIQRIQPLSGAVAVEFGAGTGRVTSLLAGHVSRLAAFDFNLPMLRVAQAKQRKFGWENSALALADSRRMPVHAGWADFAVEGWAFLQIAVWHPQEWQTQLSHALDEMERIVRPGGKMILIETLGTGQSEPKVEPFFRKVYDFLETERGFNALDIRTDYCFESLEQVRQVVVPLFGQEMLERLVKTGAGWVLPECTGLWWRLNPAQAGRSLTGHLI
jgi:ubiquinone/menaquinone biosynthesis C-methylase UbiE